MKMSSPSKPKPYRRPSVDLSGLDRAWQTVQARYLAHGDMVPDHGRVETYEDYEEYHPLTGHTRLHIVTFLSGEVVRYEFDEQVYAFTARG